MRTIRINDDDLVMGRPADVLVEGTQLDPSARSALNDDIILVYSNDFDGYPMATVLLNGVPVMYVTHPASNWGDCGDEKLGLYGWQTIIVDSDNAQQQSVAALYEHVGEAGEGFSTHVADHGIHKAWDDFEGLGDGHELLAFVEMVAGHLHRRFPDDCPEPPV